MLKLKILKTTVATMALTLIAACEKEPLSVRLNENDQALAKQICGAIEQTRKFDTSARREILKDYGFPEPQISEFESSLEYGFTPATCVFHLSFGAKMYEMTEAE